MLDFPRWKVIWLWALTLSLVLCAAPSLLRTAGVAWPEFLPDPQINLGLDLAGGSQILLEADPRQVAKLRIENMEENVRGALRTAEPRIPSTVNIVYRITTRITDCRMFTTSPRIALWLDLRMFRTAP